MIYGISSTKISMVKHRVIQIIKIKDQCSGFPADYSFVQFVPQNKKPLVLIEPALMGIMIVLIVYFRNGFWICFISNIHNYQFAFVRSQKNFLTAVVLIWPIINDHLGIVAVSSFTITPNKSYAVGIVKVQEMNPSKKFIVSIGSHYITIAAIWVNGYIVGRCYSFEHPVGGKVLFGFCLPQSSEIKNLYSVISCLTDDISVIVMNLDVSPRTGFCFSGQFTNQNGFCGFAYIDKCCPVI